ncbi:MAG: HEAT repeat domain-containing protein [Limnospira sp. PMC 894.15]|uniref:HEAT repeat domain-containing protein n=2 Tax=Limnospira TaxID=2596745 RepID=UPI0028E16B73|nr:MULTISPECIES: HEAT repeat domain-containing protein [unclassified Limnospira]MDT9188087.1 HEAT repeat domain-containing protein [Limnospira sp. PMC 894.15]MDT9233954.1 HEAT repeat domain-containing protein [Limnospira sp. PMC 917.15]MDT9274778.1 HEAT repeat domain-containing protein [Limnospira sp. PMC 737.11]
MEFDDMNELVNLAKVASDNQDWSQVVYCLQQFGVSGENDGWEEAIALALTTLQYGDFHTRWDVAKLLPKLGKSACVPLIEIFEDEAADLEYRWFAGRILGDFHTPEAIACLVNFLSSDADDELIAIAASALANLGPETVASLTTLLEDPKTRLMGVRALSQIRISEVISPLLTVVEDPDPQVRAIAIETLGSFRDDRVIPALINALEDHAAIVRSEAVISLGFRSDIATQWHLVESIDPLLYDINLTVCQQAAMALGRLKTDAAIESLSTILQSSLTPIPLQIACIKALIWMESSAGLDCIAQCISGFHETVILETIQLLGRLKTANLKNQAGQMLLDLFRTEHPSLSETRIKQALAYALGQLGDAKTMEVLQVLQTDVNDSVKFHAIAAIRQLETISTQPELSTLPVCETGNY